jgi:hypothetical protein
MAIEETKGTNLRVWVSSSAKLGESCSSSKAAGAPVVKPLNEQTKDSKASREEDKEERKRLKKEKEKQDEEQKLHDKIMKQLQKLQKAAVKEPAIEGTIQQVVAMNITSLSLLLAFFLFGSHFALH